MPRNFAFRSNSSPSTYAYPPVIELEKKEEVKEVKKAELSTTAKAKAKAAKKKKEKDGADDMEVDSTKAVDESANAKDEAGKDQEAEKKADATPEPDFELLQNPARVTLRQRSVIAVEENQRYVPVKNVCSRKRYGLQCCFPNLPCIELVWNGSPARYEA